MIINFDLRKVSKITEKFFCLPINIVYVPYNTEEIRHAHKSKQDLKSKNQVIFLIITETKNDIILL